MTWSVPVTISSRIVPAARAVAAAVMVMMVVKVLPAVAAAAVTAMISDCHSHPLTSDNDDVESDKLSQNGGGSGT